MTFTILLSIKVPRKVSFQKLIVRKAATPVMRTDLMSNLMILTKSDKKGAIRRYSRTSKFYFLMKSKKCLLKMRERRNRGKMTRLNAISLNKCF